jgi:Glyoxalase-like domain
MRRAVDFWTATLAYVRREGEWDPQFMMLVDPARRRLPISMRLTDSGPKEPVRVHLDLYTREQARHVERVARLGATRVDDWPYPRTRPGPDRRSSPAAPDRLFDQGLGVRAAFGVVAGQQVLPGAAGEYVRELPGQVVGIT